MPTYTYKCDNEECDIHGILLEVRQSMKDDPVKICPDCEKETFNRVIAPSTFHLKGRGWYKTGGY